MAASRTVRLSVLPEQKARSWVPADQGAYDRLVAARRRGVPAAELTDLWYAAGCPPLP